ncbi:integrase core domain-containing protein [Aidingimonas lacisalsi]
MGGSLDTPVSSLNQAGGVINCWIRYYNEERPHKSLGYVAPRTYPALAA